MIGHDRTAVEWDLLMDATRRHSWEGLKTERLKAEKRRWFVCRRILMYSADLGILGCHYAIELVRGRGMETPGEYPKV